MEQRFAKILFAKNGNGFDTTRITLPVGWVKEMGATSEDRDVVIVFKDKKIEIIKKEDFHMKKWAVITRNGGMDEWAKSYESKEKAVEMAEKEWSSLTAIEKKHNEIIVGLVNLNADDNSYEDSDGNIDSDVYEIAITLNGEEEQRRYDEKMNNRE